MKKKGMTRRLLAIVCAASMLLTPAASAAAAAESDTASVTDAIEEEALSAASDAADAAPEEAAGAQADAAPETAAEGQAPADAAMNPEQPIPNQSAFPQICISRRSEYKWAKDGSRLLVECRYPMAMLTAEGQKQYPKLWKKLRRINGVARRKMKSVFKDLKKQARESKLQGAKEAQGPLMTSTAEYLVRRSDSHLVSILRSEWGYTGGAHGYYAYSGLNISTGEGRILSLSDLVTDRAAFWQLVQEGLKSRYTDLEESLFNEYFAEEDVNKLEWTAGYDGITCYFNPYTLGPYAIGAQTVTIPYAGHESIFTPEACDVPAVFGMQLPLNLDTMVGYHTLVMAGEVGAYDNYESILFNVDGNKVSFPDQYAFSITPTWIHTADGDFIYVDCLQDNDYHTVDVYRIDSAVEYVGDFSGGACFLYRQKKNGRLKDSGYVAFTDPEHLLFDTRVYMLSSLTGTQVFRTGGDGMPVPYEDYYYIRSPRALTVRKSFTAPIVDEKGETLREEELPAGETLWFYRTDNRTYMDCRLKNGDIARLQVEMESWPQTINGEEIETLLDGILFAG